jgi:hypothetical protein
MNEVIVNGMGEFEFAVRPAVKGRSLVFLGRIQVPPVVIWFYVLQMLFITAQSSVNCRKENSKK